MGLNFKSERVHALAREAAARTGKTLTGAIEEALARFLRDLGDDAETEQRRTAVTRILDDVDRRLASADPAAMNTDELYDGQGMPT